MNFWIPNRLCQSVLQIFVCCCVLLCTSPQAKGTLPRVLVFSYTNHPTTQQYYLPIIRQAYQNLGIEIQLVEAGPDRFIQLYQEGKIDGDIGRTATLKQLLPRMQLVYQIDEMKISYHCSARVKCSPADLTDPALLIFTPVVKKVQDMVKLKISARTYEVNNWQQLLDMYQQQKVDRFIMVDGKRFHTTLQLSLQRFFVPHLPIPFYHMLHHKHSQLTPLVAAEIAKVLASYPHLPASNEPLHALETTAHNN